jgi:hypothetical protein
MNDRNDGIEKQPEQETITVKITIGDHSYSASIQYVPDGLNHERHLADAITSAAASVAATDGNTSLPCLMASIADQYVSPSIVQAAGWVFRNSDIDESGHEDWKIIVESMIYPTETEIIPRGVEAGDVEYCP